MAELSPEYLDGGKHTVTGKPELEIPSDTLPEDYRSFSFKSSGIFDREKWTHCIREIAPGVLRAKGVVHFPEEKLYFEIINGEYSEKEPPEQLALNPKSIFVFISSTAPEISFEDKIKECTVS